MSQKWRVAFLCRENSCRSQIAEALAKEMASDIMEIWSAGMRPVDCIDPGAVRMLKETHGIDMLAAGQKPKTVAQLPEVDIIVYMGCRVECARHPCRISLGWDISDPKGMSDDAYRKAIHDIEQNIFTLRRNIITGKINQWRKENLKICFPSVFPFWNEMTQPQQEQILSGWRTEVFPPKKQIYETSEACKGIMIVQQGSLRVYTLSEQGKEVTLYRLLPGEICVLAASRLINELEFDIVIEAAEYTEVATIPAGDLERILPENPMFELFLYKKIAQRFSNVMWTVQNVFLRKIDQRIASYLLEEMKRCNKTALRITHDQIAREVFSVREVVSKNLHRFAQEGFIEVRNREIVILDKNRLEMLI